MFSATHVQTIRQVKSHPHVVGGQLLVHADVHTYIHVIASMPLPRMDGRVGLPG